MTSTRTISTDVYSAEKRSNIMSSVRSKGTAPELAVRSVLRELGIRYRLHRKDLPGSPDLVVQKQRLALFVHGCFWHHHTCAKGTNLPKQNSEFWRSKIARTVIRDRENEHALADLGWHYAIIWECQTRKRESLFKLVKCHLVRESSWE